MAAGTATIRYTNRSKRQRHISIFEQFTPGKPQGRMERQRHAAGCRRWAGQMHLNQGTCELVKVGEGFMNRKESPNGPSALAVEHVSDLNLIFASRLKYSLDTKGVGSSHSFPFWKCGHLFEANVQCISS